MTVSPLLTVFTQSFGIVGICKHFGQGLGRFQLSLGNSKLALMSGILLMNSLSPSYPGLRHQRPEGKEVKTKTESSDPRPI